MWSDHKVVRRCGCGPVAAYDLLLYLEKKEHGKDLSFPLTRQEYIRGLEKLQRRYFPLLYPRGINGLLLTFGLNRMFLERRLPYVAVWAASGRKLFARMADMLRHDIPVVLSVFLLSGRKTGWSFTGLHPTAVFFLLPTSQGTTLPPWR